MKLSCLCGDLAAAKLRRQVNNPSHLSLSRINPDLFPLSFFKAFSNIHVHMCKQDEAAGITNVKTTVTNKSEMGCMMVLIVPQTWM